MVEWITSFWNYAISNGQVLLVGGAIVVGAVIFLIGVMKKLFLDKIPNKLVRKMVLSFLSLILVFPATIVTLIYNGVDMQYLWVLYGINAVSTIVVYWFYENTGMRNLFALIGKNTVFKLLSAMFSHKDKNETAKEIVEDTKTILADAKYDENDLKNL